MKRLFQHILYYALRVWVFLVGITPFWLLYRCSDVCYFVIYRLVGYRRKVVHGNLTRSFPDKTQKEIASIERTFYRHLCDWAFENIKLYSLPEKEVKRRLVYKNLDQLGTLIAQERSGFVLMGHCANWEYVTAMPAWFAQFPKVCFGHVYRPQHNRVIDRFFCEMRSRFRSQNISEFELLRDVLRMKREGKVYCIGVLADQIPNINGLYQWVDFLNQDTVIYNGIQKVAAKVGAYLGYFEISRLKRGYYEARFRLLVDDTTAHSETELASLYIKEVEKTIRKFPPYWLWTHNRWKRKRINYEEYRYE